ncbi:MAG: thiolase domain-containing protein [Anaerolineales bacterium]|uniref:Thiolase domain-containing protein n=1 Tax=Candidatus Desulfolinea nitratireducens TaxID=2841698 RepID=A0A8J6THX3_9CHLR|nr:thiolase domain-containing protein [Candidatus Desulfolinea nitratireducens]MBL6959710.1 thiolase domain-containing protein [Anaerolineales bacterium]
MRKVAIIGIGQTKVDEHWNRTIRDLAGEAIFAALQDAGREEFEALFSGNMLSGLIDQQNNLGAVIADWIGFKGESIKIESACSSGGAAFRAGIMAIASGELDSAMVVGVEKMTDAAPTEVTSALATAADSDWELEQGISFVGLNALIMRRYMHEYGWKHEDFAPFSLNAHANATHNPNARLPYPITLDQFNNAHMVATPINLMDASPIGDGAAAVLIVPLENVRDNKGAVQITGSGAATDTISVHSRKAPLFLQAAYLSAQRAYSEANITPQQIDFFELHDAFSIMSALSLEACGFAERGQGPRLGLDNEITPKGGRIPICTRGGLKARGHPVGATGIYQIVETVQQLRGECGETQVAAAKIGMTQNIGGSGASILTHIIQII